MKLYFSPGACSLAPRIALIASGLPFDSERVNLRTKLTAGGEDFRAINPKGYVPALALEGGQLLTESQVILLYVADQASASTLAPAHGTFERYESMEWLAWTSTELHKRFSPIFAPGASSEAKEAAWAALAATLTYLADQIGDDGYLVGGDFTVADAYLFTVLNWVGFTSFSLDSWPALQAYHARIKTLPAVQEALRQEGLQ
ncbi:glutathione transferase GstA [Oxalobacteraceae sp. CFBP 13730]|nr:glutathione transferase GstA [Oxalobacteraceae sp. CFBP 13730]